MVEFIKLKDDDKEDKNNNNKSNFKAKISFKKILLVGILFFIISSTISGITYSNTPKIGIVPINGPILTQKVSSFSGTSISSREISNTLYELERDDSVKAILLDINSPGGSPVASEEISRAIEKVKLSKPVYALINDVGASGAFWVAVSANKIYASSMSTVGSIGVTSATLGFEDFIKNYNVTYRRLTSGEIKDIGTPFRKPNEKENELVLNLLKDIHKKFIDHVSKSRNLEYSYVEKYATGAIFLGDKAKEIGFVDEIGYYPDVISELKTITNLTGEVLILDYSPSKTFIEQLGFGASFNFIPFMESKQNIMLN